MRGQDVLRSAVQLGLTATFDGDLGVLKFAGAASPAAYQSALRSVTYENTSDGPSELTRTLTFVVDDGEQGANLGTASRSVVVLGVNDAPTQTDDGPLAPIAQDTPSPPGQRLSTVLRGLIRDPDPNDFLAGVAVVGNSANSATEGAWQYSTDNGGTWLPIGAVADGPTALALAADTRLRFVPVVSYAGQPTPLGVRVIDSTYVGGFTVGAVRVAIDPTPGGGTTPFSMDAGRIVTTVFPAGSGGNSPPALSGVPVSANIDEGQSLSFTASATDTADTDLGQALAFSLVGAPAGAPIDPDAGEFSWTPTEAQRPDTYVFQVAVTDGLATTAKTITVVVRELNSAPVLAGVPASAITSGEGVPAPGLGRSLACRSPAAPGSE